MNAWLREKTTHYMPQRVHGAGARDPARPDAESCSHAIVFHDDLAPE